MSLRKGWIWDAVWGESGWRRWSNYDLVTSLDGGWRVRWVAGILDTLHPKGRSEAAVLRRGVSSWCGLAGGVGLQESQNCGCSQDATLVGVSSW